MPAKTIPLSVRVTDEDAEFIAGLAIEGATTPSDKLRAIIAQARRRVEGAEDYTTCLGLIEDFLAPAQRQLKTREHDLRVHSELVQVLSEWLPEAVAFFMSNARREVGEPGHGAADRAGNGARDRSGDGAAVVRRLQDFERGLADRVFALLETVLRMGVTRRCRGYDPDLVRDRLEPILELSRVIQTHNDRGDRGEEIP